MVISVSHSNVVQNLRESVSPHPTLEGERIAGCRVPVAVALSALAAEQDVADPEGEKWLS